MLSLRKFLTLLTLTTALFVNQTTTVESMNRKRKTTRAIAEDQEDQSDETEAQKADRERKERQEDLRAIKLAEQDRLEEEQAQLRGASSASTATFTPKRRKHATEATSNTTQEVPPLTDEEIIQKCTQEVISSLRQLFNRFSNFLDENQNIPYEEAKTIFDSFSARSINAGFASKNGIKLTQKIERLQQQELTKLSIVDFGSRETRQAKRNLKSEQTDILEKYEDIKYAEAADNKTPNAINVSDLDENEPLVAYNQTVATGKTLSLDDLEDLLKVVLIKQDEFAKAYCNWLDHSDLSFLEVARAFEKSGNDVRKALESNPVKNKLEQIRVTEAIAENASNEFLVGFSALPNELKYTILDNLSVEDGIEFGKTCKMFKAVKQSLYPCSRLFPTNYSIYDYTFDPKEVANPLTLTQCKTERFNKIKTMKLEIDRNLSSEAISDGIQLLPIGLQDLDFSIMNLEDAHIQEILTHCTGLQHFFLTNLGHQDGVVNPIFDETQNILSLKRLGFKNTRNLSAPVIRSRQLENLLFTGCTNISDEIVIDTPNLQRLSIHHCNKKTILNILKNNFSNLQNLVITTNYEAEKNFFDRNLREAIAQCQNLRRLIINSPLLTQTQAREIRRLFPRKTKFTLIGKDFEQAEQSSDEEEQAGAAE